MEFCVFQLVSLLIITDKVISDVWRNSNCFTNGYEGRCVSYIQCTSAIGLIKSGYHPKICTFEGHNPIVCCPEEDIKKSNTASEKCDEFKDIVSVFDRIFRISVVGGTDAYSGEFKHMAALGYGDSNDIRWLCGGSLISEKYILTAAHCLESTINGPVKYVRLGEVDIEAKSKTLQEYKVLNRIPHPDFNPPLIYNDIGLVELASNVIFTSFIQPACLITNETHETFEATGWGLTQFGGSTSTILQKVKLELFSKEECKQSWKSTERRLPFGITDSQICAGDRYEEKDTCQGDSGGPLQVKDFTSVLHVVVGVTSIGKSCGVRNVPTIYTKTSSYLPWIESIVWG